MAGADVPPEFEVPRTKRQGEDRTLVEFPQEELIAKWEEFFEEMGYLSRIIAVADRYPEERSLEVAFTELNRFDTDMAIYLMRHPLNVLTAGEEAMRRLVPPGEELAQIHLRVKGLPRDRRVQIRDLRAKHLGQYISVEGLVRKSTEVRPRVVGALFQCLRCGTIIKEEQDGQNFREPLECYEEQGGCKRSASATKFKLLTETSLYLDTQKLEIQESPEGLRGGEEPQRLTAYVEDDLTGHITPGQRIILNGILRSVQKGRPGAKSTLFDIFIDVNSTEMETVEFEEIEVTEEDVRLIRGAGSNPDIIRMMVNSIAPSIYGLHVEKEALALQLFSGVAKVMPDGRRIRGDIHLLLVGDPGTAKSELLSYMSRLSPRGIYATGKAASAAGLCVAGESLIPTTQGMQSIETLAGSRFRNPERSRPLETAEALGEVATFDDQHRMALRRMETVWRLKPPAVLLELKTSSGLAVGMTPATKVLVDHAMGQSWIQARFVRKGMRIATARRVEFPEGKSPLVFEFLRDVGTRISVEVDPGFMEEIVRGLEGKFGTLREAANRLLVPEGALYHQWRSGRHAVPLNRLIALASAAGLSGERVAEAVHAYSQAGGHRITLPARLTEDFAYFTGLIAGDGSIERGALGGYSIRFSNSEPGLIEAYVSLVKRLFDVDLDFTPSSPERAATCRFHSQLIAVILGKLGIPTSPKSNRITLSDVLLNGPRPLLAAYLRGLFDTDGTIQDRRTGSTCLSLTTTSKELAERTQLAFLRFGIHAHTRMRKVAGRKAVRLDGKVIVSRHDQYVLDIRDWASLARFREAIGLRHPEKARRLAGLMARNPHSNTDLISGAGPHLREVRRLMGLTVREAYGPRSAGARALEASTIAATHESLADLIARLSGIHASGAWEGYRITLPASLRETLSRALHSMEIHLKVLGTELGIGAHRVAEYFYRSGRRPPGIPVLVLKRLADYLRSRQPALSTELDAEVRPLMQRLSRIPSRLEFLRTLASGDVRWEPVQDVRASSAKSRSTVYDLTVQDAHAFVANGILVHNTAAAVRDEFGEGRWTLEAGALVLADKGLACLHPAARVFAQGGWTSIESLFRKGRADYATSKGTLLEICPLNVDTLGIEAITGKIRRAKTTLIARRGYSGPIVHVKLRSGAELHLTPDHLILDGRTRVWKQLDAFRVKDRFLAAAPRTAKIAEAAGALSAHVETAESSSHSPGALILHESEVQSGNKTDRESFSVEDCGEGAEPHPDEIDELRVEDYTGYVYDLRVPDGENFLCDGIVVHNCIDELDKMNPQDRSAIHEALEQQRISVAKAGITAVLQARCAVLAAANPKFGRFDEHKYISEQIDLPPTLLSRFDIIFSMIDRPEAEKDRQLAEHILKAHRVGEIAKRREEGAVTQEATELEDPYTPYFSPDFLRKYVAYAKRIYPVMNDEAMQIIEKKYLDIRKTGEGAGSSVPITPRQLEAIVRLSEAGARLRLSETVEADDAERAVRIVEYWMGKVAGEEGRFDIDIIQTGISQSQREQIISLRDIINELAGPEGVADYEDIVRVAQDRGIPPAKVDSWLKRWSQEGEIYSPAKNKYKLVERL